jgi:Tol biopolymer transport system component
MTSPARPTVHTLGLAWSLLAAGTLAACASTGGDADRLGSGSTGGAAGGETDGAAPPPPVPGAVLANDLIQPGETRFKNLWRLTFGGQNAEAYWSFEGDQLSLQLRETNAKDDCDQIYVTSPSGDLRQVSTGRGVTTCAFFMPGDEQVLYASTQSGHVGCPIKPESEGYTWMLWPDYEIYVTDLKTGEETTLVSEYGYDAEATVSPLGDRIVDTSTRSGDLELWTCDLEGNGLVQVTDTPGYDGGAFFSHDGQRLVFRATAWTPGQEAEEQQRYREDLDRWQVRPNSMEIFTVAADGSDRQQVTTLGGANFAPYFTPDDQQIIFATNHHDTAERKFNFDIFLCDLDGTGLEQVTHFDGPPGKKFDGFPMFSRDGKYLAFASNRGAGAPGDTDVFIAEWAD